MSAMKDLQAAHKSMMDWMQGFGARFDSDEILNGKELSAEKKQWLLEEEKKVYQLKEDINGSISRAEELLSEN
jgi:antibiotic biosynthesis monooxygenase (ABM) superfamily enzyme